MTHTIALQANHIAKHYHHPHRFQVLKDIEFDVKKGEFLTLMGKSGSGKSTLLYVLSTMDTDYDGMLVINDELLTGQSQDKLTTFRNKNIGFVFQFHYLLPEFSVLDNVMIPALKLNKLTKAEVEEKAYQHLKSLGLQDQILKPSRKLSGGQQQRVAIARALINDPSIIMGDEPTGNLDSKNTQLIFEIFQKLSKNNGQTIITVTHDESFAKNSDRIIELRDGCIISS